MSSTSSQGRRVNAAVVRARSAGRAVEQGESIHEDGGGITYRPRNAREGSRSIGGEWLAHSGQRHVRAKGAPFHLVPQIRGSDFHVVVQKLETRLTFHAHPYDTRAPKVRKGADAGERQLERSVSRYELLDNARKSGDARLVCVTEEFQGEVQLVGGHPGQPGIGIT